MRSAKYIGLFAACGFILSFVSGLFSHSSILSVLLKALIFAVVFGLLGLGISFIYSKFLSDGTGGEFQSDYTADTSSVPAAGSALGNNVDITIQDEELAPSESENHYVVGENHQMLNDSDVRGSQGGNSDAQSSSQGFVPLRNFETVKNFSGKEAVIPAEAVAVQAAEPVEMAEEVTEDSTSQQTQTENSTSPAAFSGGGDGGIDTLPDMENFVFSESSGSASDDDDSGTDSEFVSMGSSKKNNGPAEVQDAALMAKAISSVLSDENS